MVERNVLSFLLLMCQIANDVVVNVVVVVVEQ